MRIAVAVIAFLMLGCSKPELLPNYGQLPEFSLVDQFGAPRTLADLKDNVWVADFVFTRCAGPCPRMSRHLANVQDALAEEPRVRFVSVSVDPEYDTPDRMADYARRFGANTATWWFLTGDKGDIYQLVKDGFQLAVDDGMIGPDGEPGEGIITHSTKFVLVDHVGRIRGYYSGDDESDGEELYAKITAGVQSVLAELN